MKRPVGVGQPLDGADLPAGRLDRQYGAGLHGNTVEVHHACPTLAGIAADVRAREAERVPQEVHEQRSCFRTAFNILAVHAQGNGKRTGRLPRVSSGPGWVGAVGAEPEPST